MNVRSLFPRSVAGRVICVLGMHRSGTSCLAGTLEQAGVFLGDVPVHNAFNVKGNRENLAVRTINGQVLFANGGEWNRPPTQPLAWGEAQLAAQDELIRTYLGHPVWGFKDPRTLLTLEGWLAVLPDLEFAGVVRHPLAVARSLRNRPRGPELTEGLKLWTIYNTRLWEYQQQFGFPLVSFDAPAEHLRWSLSETINRLGLSASCDAASEPFFDPDLKHQTTPGTDDAETVFLQDETLSLYQRLTDAAL